MYTIDDQENNTEYEVKESSFWNDNKGIIVKIIIIILCIIVLIWLFKALRTKNNTVVDDESVRIANVLKIRLAAEDYFFNKKNKSDENDVVVSLFTLKNKGLVNEIVDGNNKVCSENISSVKLSPTTDSYKMLINLVCSTKDSNDVFVYDKKTLVCSNCGNSSAITDEARDKEEEKKEEQKDDDKEEEKKDDVVIDPNYSCNEWSAWTKTRVVNKSYLVEKTKTLVQGVKYGKTTTKTVYGDWSEYSKTPIKSSKTLEVQTKEFTVKTWSKEKTSTSIDANDSNIRIVKKETKTKKTNNCKNGTVIGTKCYSKDTYTGNLTMQEFTSGKYNVINNKCERVEPVKNADGKYYLTYINCEYNKLLGNATKTTKYTVYTYQELIKTKETRYRSRTVKTVTEKQPDVYTDIKYEEGNLPNGYVKVNGSEETYYSYKIGTCVK